VYGLPVNVIPIGLYNFIYRLHDCLLNTYLHNILFPNETLLVIIIPFIPMFNTILILYITYISTLCPYKLNVLKPFIKHTCMFNQC